MIYDGTSAHANGEASGDRVIEDVTLQFNEDSGDNAFVGYMYGAPGAGTYEETHLNINDSLIKQINDRFYLEYIQGTKYKYYVADAIYCNDRLVSEGLGVGAEYTMYSSIERLGNANPILKCPQGNDKFTISSNLGNGNLNFPIGLITVDEVNMAGGGFGLTNNKYYLYDGYYYWTMSPVGFNGEAYVVYVENGVINVSDSVAYPLGLRPVISLKSDTLFTGNGTMESPFEIVS